MTRNQMENKWINKNNKCDYCGQYKNPFEDHDVLDENPENFYEWSNQWDGGIYHQECHDNQ